MKAIVQDEYGSPDVLELRDIDTPQIGDNEVLVRVRAAGVDRGVWHLSCWQLGGPILVASDRGLVFGSNAQMRSTLASFSTT